MTEEQKKLMADNYPLVYAFANRFAFNSSETDDYINAGYEALYSAAVTYDPDNRNGSSFSTYASACIMNGMRVMYKHIMRSRVKAGQMKENYRFGDNPEEEELPYEEPGFVRAENEDVCSQALKNLTEEQRNYIVRRYFCKETARSIAKERGVSPQRMCQKEKKILEKMRKNVTGRRSRS
nr:MAG TPA: DNA directed RNA polymerase subunit [Caudoviricetes sp.]